VYQFELSQEEVVMSEELKMVESETLATGKWYRFVRHADYFIQFVLDLKLTARNDPYVDVFLLSSDIERAGYGDGSFIFHMVKCVIGERVGFLVISNVYDPVTEFPKSIGTFYHLSEDE
jgi:hypothetical protein